MMRQVITLFCLGAALCVAGCGKLGALERPGPATGVDVGPDPMKTRTIDPRNRNADPSPSVSAAEPGSATPGPQ